LIPSSRSEQQAVEAANDFAQQHGQPVKDELQRAASDVHKLSATMRSGPHRK